jgi:M6 family metalloprotease-like protein
MPALNLAMPTGPMFVGSYARIPVTIAAGAGFSFDDLDFTIPDGPAAGQVSPSRESTFDPAHPEIMLLAGYQPGTYQLEVRERSTQALLAQKKFGVTGLWKDQDAGPPFWFTGRMDPYAVGAWGGGPPGPQNMNVHPAPAKWRLAAVMIDFTDQLYPTDAATLQGFQDEWYDNIVTGVMVSGSTRSTQAYYHEVSYGKTDLVFTRGDMYGPVHLPGTWKTFYTQIPAPDGRWLVNDMQALVTGVQAALDFTQYDVVLFIPPKGPADPSDQKGTVAGVLTAVPRFAWGVSTVGKRPFTTNKGDIALACSSMSNEWRTFAGTFAHSALTHELGHTLGLLDQYFNPPSLKPREVDGWDPMAGGDDTMPCFCLAHRMMLGWVDAAAIRTFDFAQSIGPVDQVVTLHPAELVPPAGATLGIEVRIADGLNYYFEYRKTQPNQSGDQLLLVNRDNVVLGTDVASSPPPNTRANILSLDGEPTGLADGEGYTENSVTNTAWPGTFNADVSGVTGAQADVRIRYGVNGKPDPAIRPWPASPSRPWQSPDIEVQNLRNQQDPANWFNVPWLGHANTIVATITNRGNIPAPQVRADFYIKDFTVTDAPETYLQTDHQNMQAGEAVKFQATWTPSAAGHFCVIVRIPHYVPPMAPNLDELTDLNNEAQSNYDRFISASGSPASRVVTSVAVFNPYTQRTRVYVCPAQSNPLYRTYLGNTWVALDPGESRSIEVMVEYGPVGNSDRDAALFGTANLRKFTALPNDLNMLGLIEYPPDRHILHPMGGAQVRVAKGKGTRIDGLAHAKGIVSGTVVVASTGKAVSGGKVLVTTWTGRGTSRKESASFPVPIRQGRFQAQVKDGWSELEAYYLPPQDYADCSATLGAK